MFEINLKNRYFTFIVGIVFMMLLAISSCLAVIGYSFTVIARFVANMFNIKIKNN